MWRILLCKIKVDLLVDLCLCINLWRKKSTPKKVQVLLALFKFWVQRRPLWVFREFVIFAYILCKFDTVELQKMYGKMQVF